MKMGLDFGSLLPPLRAIGIRILEAQEDLSLCLYTFRQGSARMEFHGSNVSTNEWRKWERL